MKYSTIVITDKDLGISRDNKIPWEKIEAYEKYFHLLTKNKILLLGKKTYNQKIYNLKNSNYDVLSRIEKNTHIEKNILDNRRVYNNNDFTQFKSFNEKDLKLKCSTDYIVVGGEETYRYYNDPEEIFLFKLHKYYNCDKFFDKIPNNYYLCDGKYFSDDEGVVCTLYKYKKYSPGNIGENGYINLCKKVLSGDEVDDRTGTGVVSVFGSNNISFDLKYGIPLLTTKKMAYKSIIAELIWFLRGSTNLKELQELGCKVWDANADVSVKNNIPFLKNSSPEDCGAIYGFQWRHFGAKYVDCHTDYKGQGFDQIQYIINEIRKNPSSRRLILSAWNPPDLDKTILPPCHMTAQFNVINGRLNCQVYQRSADVFLGVPFNIFSYAVLLHIIARKCDLIEGKLHFSFGDAHIYKNHLTQIREQIARNAYAFPVLNSNIKTLDFDEMTPQNFTLEGYYSHPKITGVMSV